MKKFLLTLVILALPHLGISATINVPADQPTIQAGIDVAITGDTVLVDDGTYTGQGNYNINFDSKNITVLSSGGPNNTIVDCQSLGCGFIFNGGESTALLKGFTIKNGNAITDRQLTGGGIFIDNSSPTIDSCIFKNNYSGHQGGAVGCFDGSPNFNYCIFIENVAAYGAAVYLNDSDGNFQYCTFFNNQASIEGAGFRCDGSVPTISNCIIAFSSSGQAISGGAWFDCCNIFGNAGGDWVDNIAFQYGKYGNISSDPLFCDTLNLNLSLFVYSQSISTCGNMGALDIGCTPTLPFATYVDYSENSGNNVITTLTPEIYWTYFDTTMTAQAAYEIEVSSDDDWSVAELWSSGQVFTSDTSASYDGEPLSNNSNYFLRIRVSNGNIWSGWNYNQFTTHLPGDIFIPTQFSTIQEGIDVALTNDTVYLEDGIFTGLGNCDINFKGKAITVKSLNGPTKSIIDCNGTESEPHRGFNFINGETFSSTLDGVTIRNGYGTKTYLQYGGGGIMCQNSSPRITNCIFQDNYGDRHGGALCCFYSSPTITNCTFINNAASYGSALYSHKSHPELYNCIIAFNDADGEAIGCTQGGTATLHCSNMYDNYGGDYVACTSGQQNMYGNISSDPQFCNYSESDFSLASTSPCLPSNNGCTELMGALGLGCDQVSTTWNVYVDGSGDAPTIQAAIDSCIDYDRVLIHPGTYLGEGNNDLRTNGKAIVVKGVAGPDSTIIDCEGYIGFYMDDKTGEDSSTSIEGLTITNAWIGLNIVGHFFSPYPSLKNLKFINNPGYGISDYRDYDLKNTESKEDYNLYVSNCQFRKNDLAGIKMSFEPFSFSFVLDSCLFDSNGTGISASAKLKHCTFTNNVYAIRDNYDWGFKYTIDSCLFEKNQSSISGSLTLTNSIIRDGGIVIGGYQWPGSGIVDNCIFENISGTAIKTNTNGTMLNCIIRNCEYIASCGSFEEGNTSTAFINCQMISNQNGITTRQHLGKLTMENCLYSGNGGPIKATYWHKTIIKNCTITNNLSDAIVKSNGKYMLTLENSIVSSNQGMGVKVHPDDSLMLSVICSNVYDNAGGNYSGISDQTGLNGNISEDPLFCELDTTYSISNFSPCAPHNNSCGVLMGAVGVGCGTTCGDVNSDSSINVSDIVFLINYLFVGGDEPDPLEISDVNCDDKTSLVDIIYIVNYIFRSGPEPCACSR